MISTPAPWAARKAARFCALTLNCGSSSVPSMSRASSRISCRFTSVPSYLARWAEEPAPVGGVMPITSHHLSLMANLACLPRKARILDNVPEVIKSTSRNRDGKACAKCDQIAFIIVVFACPGQDDKEVPLCGTHFLEACGAHPELGYMP